MDSQEKARKFVHFTSTGWLVLTFFYIFINALRYWGLKWWVIFSLSGYSLLIVLLLVSFYLFAIYNGLVRNKKNEKEHPLTRTSYYMFLYDLSPFIGAFAGLFAITDANDAAQSMTILAIGTFSVTFIFWIVVDPAFNLIEAAIPQSRALRRQRLEQEKTEKLLHKKHQQELLATLQKNERDLINSWEVQLLPLAEDLAEDLRNHSTVDIRKIIDYGLLAWQYGGKECMARLKSKTVDLLYGQASQSKEISQVIDLCWNGVGDWTSRVKVANQ